MSFPQYTPGDILIWRKPTQDGHLLIKVEYLYRTDEKIAVQLSSGEKRYADPKQLRRPVFSVNVRFSEIRNFQEALS